jgi:virginiamycin B lyase
MEDLEMIGRRNMLCGMHVHVELPDTHAWVGPNKIGGITTSGVITEFPVGNIGILYGWIAAGPDGALCFTESAANKIAADHPGRRREEG